MDAEDSADIVDEAQTFFDRHCIRCHRIERNAIGYLQAGKPSHLQLHIHARGEIFNGALGEFGCIRLKPVRRVEHHCLHGSWQQRSEATMG
jgi:hypothetical protein